jgi:hypothetical protein
MATLPEKQKRMLDARPRRLNVASDELDASATLARLHSVKKANCYQ